MTLIEIPSDQLWLWECVPDSSCVHQYDDDEIFEETEYTGSYLCLRCGCKLTFDVSDIGD